MWCSFTNNEGSVFPAGSNDLFTYTKPNGKSAIDENYMSFYHRSHNSGGSLRGLDVYAKLALC